MKKIISLTTALQSDSKINSNHSTTQTQQNEMQELLFIQKEILKQNKIDNYRDQLNLILAPMNNVLVDSKGARYGIARTGTQRIFKKTISNLNELINKLKKIKNIDETEFKLKKEIILAGLENLESNFRQLHITIPEKIIIGILCVFIIGIPIAIYNAYCGHQISKNQKQIKSLVATLEAL